MTSAKAPREREIDSPMFISFSLAYFLILSKNILSAYTWEEKSLTSSKIGSPSHALPVTGDSVGLIVAQENNGFGLSSGQLSLGNDLATFTPGTGSNGRPNPLLNPRNQTSFQLFRSWLNVSTN
ncbi:hypothetical protein LWI28_020553 [Acer negundo]|uniref:Uncharacterized protein n=1 Tax=Acer negundo TaxID=4023 RepID=A0AAD5NSW0_ACENE|nr:hypothetical protein LWI28_020553 [Acer negundo]